MGAETAADDPWKEMKEMQAKAEADRLAAAAKREAYMQTPMMQALQLAVVVSSGACAYHGYKRNNSIWWAFWWSLAGGLFFPFAPIIAVAQGFGKPRAMKANGRRRRTRRSRRK
jgi:hypothetical protein